MSKYEKYLKLFNLKPSYTEEELTKAYRKYTVGYRNSAKLTTREKEKYKEFKDGYEYLKYYMASDDVPPEEEYNEETQQEEQSGKKVYKGKYVQYTVEEDDDDDNVSYTKRRRQKRIEKKNKSVIIIIAAFIFLFFLIMFPLQKNTQKPVDTRTYNNQDINNTNQSKKQNYLENTLRKSQPVQVSVPQKPVEHKEPYVDEKVFEPYIDELDRRITENWKPPKESSYKNFSQVVLLLNIAKDGRLLNADVQESSGSLLIDNSAVSTVKALSPYNPLPASYEGASVTIKYTFKYNNAASFEPIIRELNRE